MLNHFTITDNTGTIPLTLWNDKIKTVIIYHIPILNIELELQLAMEANPGKYIKKYMHLKNPPHYPSLQATSNPDNTITNVRFEAFNLLASSKRNT